MHVKLIYKEPSNETLLSSNKNRLQFVYLKLFTLNLVVLKDKQICTKIQIKSAEIVKSAIDKDQSIKHFW